MDPKKMKQIGMKMNIMMGISMSLSLSLLGNLASGHFTAKGFLISLAASTALSLAIGFIVPIRKLSMGACRKCALPDKTLPARLMESLISDLIYTPVITALMAYLAYSGAAGQGAPVTFSGIFLPSLILSLIVGFVLIFILQPLYLRLILRSAGQDPPSAS